MTNSNIIAFGGSYSPYAFPTAQEALGKRAPTDKRPDADLRSSARKKHIYELLGSNAKPLGDYREWRLFNQEINKEFSLGLADREIHMLSMIDRQLHKVSRFVGMIHMPNARADSTAAHSKQVINLLQTVFERAFPKKKLSPTMEILRQEALIGAWVHDMGEVVCELTTASDMFAIQNESLKRTISEKKDALESKIFIFSCELALRAIDSKNEQLFSSTIEQLRNWKKAPDTAPWNQPNPTTSITTEDTQETLMRSIDTIDKGIDHFKKTLGMTDELQPETRRMLDIYKRTEDKDKGDFLHPLVKTIESVEGQRYLQRNSAESETDALTRQLQPDQVKYVPYDLITDHEIVKACIRVERLIPMLYERSKNAGKGLRDDPLELAAATAQFTYGSIARQFLPHSYDHVGTPPELIDRNPKFELSGATLQLPDLSRVRADQLEMKRAQYASQRPGSYNSQILSCQQLGIVYRAAELASSDWPLKFQPTASSLIGFKSDESAQCVDPLPASLMPHIKEVERSVHNNVSHIQAHR